MLDSMNDIGGFTEEDFCIIFLIFGGIGILVSGLLFLIQEFRARREQRAHLESLLNQIPVDAPKHRPKLSGHFQKLPGTGPQHRY